MTQLTATFSDIQSVPSTRKNGKTKYIWVDVVDTLNAVNVKFGDVTKTLYVRTKDTNKSYAVSLYDENGKMAFGIWQHGPTGTTPHSEPLIYNYATRTLQTKTAYASGQIKGQLKYLRSI